MKRKLKSTLEAVLANLISYASKATLNCRGVVS
jgi:hypothetical protein